MGRSELRIREDGKDKRDEGLEDKEKKEREIGGEEKV